MSNIKQKLLNEYTIIIIKPTEKDYLEYNNEYLKPCKLYYKLGNKNFKCPHCMEFYPNKFNIICPK